MPKPLPSHLAFAVLAVAFVALATAYQRTVPLFEAPDEPSHMQYAGFLSVEKRLPLYGASPEVPGEGMQPPLYYALAAPLFAMLVDEPKPLMRDLRGVNLSIYEHIRQRRQPGMLIQHPARPGYRQFNQSPSLSYLRHLRWPSLLFGLLAVALSYLAALRAFGDPPLALLAAALLAFNPQFLFTSAYVSNDTLAAAVGAGSLLLVATVSGDTARVGRSAYLWTGLAAALAILTKNSILPGLGVAGLVIFCVDRRPVARRLQDALWALGLLLVLAGPYLAWNVLNRGDLLGVGAFWKGASHMLSFEAYGGALSYFTGMYWTWTFESYWGRFGWINVRLPGALYLAYLALTAFGLAGFALAARRSSALPASAPASRTLFVYLAGVAAVTLAAHLWFNVFAAQPQGRHLFPAAPQIALLLAMGLARLTNGRHDRIRSAPAAAVVVALATSAAYACFGVIAPAYG